MRSFAILREAGLRTIFDVTHSLQLPGGGTQTGGDRRFAEPLARAAGADSFVLEVHPNPGSAKSDLTTQLDPERAVRLLDSLVAVTTSVRAPERSGALHG